MPASVRCGLCEARREPTVPRCLTLRVWVDAATTPRRARIPLGKRCH
jgi:hypothetical protein